MKPPPKDKRTTLDLFTLRPIRADGRIVEYVAPIITVGQAGRSRGKYLFTFASRLLAAGVVETDINKMLGHSTLRMTARYAHSSEASRRAAVEALSGICRESVLIPAKFGKK